MTQEVGTGSGGEPRSTGVPHSGIGRLRRQPGGRRRVVKVLLSEREATVLCARAERAGVSVQRFLVESALVGDRPTVTERHGLYRTFMAARRTLAGVGNNLNQLARVANTTGQVPANLAGTTEALMAAARALEASLADLGGVLAP